MFSCRYYTVCRHKMEVPICNSTPFYFFSKKAKKLLDIFQLCAIIQKSSGAGQQTNKKIWGYSSAGRALEWHSRGQRFDPAYLHHRKSHRKPFGLRCFSLFVGKFQTFYAKMIFAQNRQNWVLSTKSVNKSVFDNKKGMEKPPSGLAGFPFTKEKFTMCAYCAR